MPKIKYIEKRFNASTMAIIDKANEIVEEYQQQGFDLTLRQLFYQFVARDLIPNKTTEYKRLMATVNNGRLAGLVDWEAITDRTRELRSNPHWAAPGDIIQTCARQYQIDKWDKQPIRIEVWVEKDALVGILESVCPDLDVAFFSCRGYTSQSEMWVAAERLRTYQEDLAQEIIVLHLGDHDPSGMDMTRDIQERLTLLSFETDIEVKRIALNIDQIEDSDPPLPPNPAKLTDVRASKYVAEFGDDSWELDALEPTRLADIIRTNVLKYRDDDEWGKSKAKELNERNQIGRVSANWAKVCAFLKKKSNGTKKPKK